jgi:hypothetical protein
MVHAITKQTKLKAKKSVDMQLMPSPLAVMELEPASTSAASEELCEWMTGSKAPCKRMSALLRHWVVRIITIVKSLSELCGTELVRQP